MVLYKSEDILLKFTPNILKEQSYILNKPSHFINLFILYILFYLYKIDKYNNYFFKNDNNKFFIIINFLFFIKIIRYYINIFHFIKFNKLLSYKKI